MSGYSLLVDDTSPIVTFIPPPPVTTTPQDHLAQGWITQFDGEYLTSLGMTGLGNSTSTHLTSLDGATFQLNFVGTGITLLGSAQQSTFDIILDGLTTQDLSPHSPNILYQAANLPQTTHSLTLVVHAQDTPDGSSFISFDKASIQASSNGASTSSSFIPDTSLNFVGSWSFMEQDPNTPLFTNASLLTYHQSTTAGDSVSFTFPSTLSTTPLSVSLLGVLGFLNGLYNVSLTSSVPGIDPIVRTYNGSFGWACGSELFAASALNTQLTSGNLTINVTNLQNKPLLIAGLNVTTAQRTLPSSSSSSTSLPSTSTTPLSTSSPSTSNKLRLSLPVGTLVALILSSLCALGLILFCIFIFLLRRRRRQRRLETAQNRRSAADDAQLAEKSKSSSSDSVLDIGRPLATQRSLTESLRDITGDRFTSLRRSGRLSLPRTAMTASDRNGGLTGTAVSPAPILTAGYSQPYTNYTYPGPTMRGVNYSPFVFSFDTSSTSNSNPKSQEPSASDAVSSNPDSSTRGTTGGGANVRRVRSEGSSYQSMDNERRVRERTSTMTKLVGGNSRATFLDLSYSQPHLPEPGSSSTQEHRSDRPDVPRTVLLDSPTPEPGSSNHSRSASGDDSSTQQAHQVVTSALHAKRHSPPRIFTPPSVPPRSPPPSHPPPNIPVQSLSRSDSGAQSPITLQSSDLENSDTNRSSLHPYVYGYAYQPSLSAASDEERSRSRPASSDPVPPLPRPLPIPPPSHRYGADTHAATAQSTIPHPYAQPTTPESLSNVPSPRSSYQTDGPQNEDNQPVGEMVFARPEPAERRRPPGIELGELRPDDPDP